MIFESDFSMEEKRFTKNDNGFTCINCGREVTPLGFTSRNHCPFCLHSLHVDINPGDRANSCMGIMRPIRTEPHSRKGFLIIHQCEKCGAVVRNRAAYGKGDMQDDLSLLISLSCGNN